MQRRDFVALSGLTALLAANSSAAEDDDYFVKDTNTPLNVLHIYASEDGESHMRDVLVSADAEGIPNTSLKMNVYKPKKIDWHTVPMPWFTINMTGDIEVEVSSGERRVIKTGDLVFLDDTHGKGHLTKPLTDDITNLFIGVPKDFDFLAWATGK